MISWAEMTWLNAVGVALIAAVCVVALVALLSWYLRRR